VPRPHAQQGNRHGPLADALDSDEVGPTDPAGVANGKRHVRGFTANDPVRVGDARNAKTRLPENEGKRAERGADTGSTEEREVGIAEPKAGREKDHGCDEKADPARGDASSASPVTGPDGRLAHGDAG
jgi:hypothetical protein